MDYNRCCKVKRTVKIMTEKKTITLRKDIVVRLEKVAKFENRNFSNLMETIAIWYLKDKN